MPRTTNPHREAAAKNVFLRETELLEAKRKEVEALQAQLKVDEENLSSTIEKFRSTALRDALSSIELHRKQFSESGKLVTDNDTTHFVFYCADKDTPDTRLCSADDEQTRIEKCSKPLTFPAQPRIMIEGQDFGLAHCLTEAEILTFSDLLDKIRTYKRLLDGIQSEVEK